MRKEHAMTSENPPVDLYKALIAAKKQIPEMGKTTTAPGLPYKYRSYEYMVAKIEPILEEHGIFIFAHTVSSEEGLDGKMRTVTIAVDYTLVHAETGQSFTNRFYGKGMDSSDKAMTKAYTYARKVMLLQVFGIADEDPDGEKPEPGESAVDRAEKIANEGYRRYEKHSREIRESENEEGAERPVLAYGGWFKSTEGSTPNIAWSAVVKREVDGKMKEITAGEYLRHLGSRLRAQSQGYSS